MKEKKSDSFNDHFREWVMRYRKDDYQQLLKYVKNYCRDKSVLGIYFCIQRNKRSLQHIRIPFNYILAEMLNNDLKP